MKVQFKLNDSDEITSTTIVSNQEKLKEYKKNAWNNKSSNGTIRSIDYNRDVTSFEPSPTCNNDGKVEVYCFEIYLRELEKQVAEAKVKELDNLNQQNVFKEEENVRQQCI